MKKIIYKTLVTEGVKDCQIDIIANILRIMSRTCKDAGSESYWIEYTATGYPILCSECTEKDYKRFAAVVNKEYPDSCICDAAV